MINLIYRLKYKIHLGKGLVLVTAQNELVLKVLHPVPRFIHSLNDTPKLVRQRYTRLLRLSLARRLRVVTYAHSVCVSTYAVAYCH